MHSNYILTSERLGFRNWKTNDIDFLHTINSNEKVMRFFPDTLLKNESEDFILKMKNQFKKYNYCYFLVEIIENKTPIGFIGLYNQTYESDFTPATDIGWRIHPYYWNKGYATEGAKAILNYGFHQLKLKKIIAVTPTKNLSSIKVMQKIGMTKINHFKHPLLKKYPKLETCVLFEKNNG